MDISKVSQALSLIIQCATIITLIYTLYKFAGRPTASLGGRVEKLEHWQETVDRRLNDGSTHFDEIDVGNRVTQEAILALIDNAIDDNHKDRLIEAKDNLQRYLINK